jgi:hypothetical protein
MIHGCVQAAAMSTLIIRRGLVGQAAKNVAPLKTATTLSPQHKSRENKFDSLDPADLKKSRQCDRILKSYSR